MKEHVAKKPQMGTTHLNHLWESRYGPTLVRSLTTVIIIFYKALRVANVVCDYNTN